MANEVNSLKSLKKNNKSTILRLLYEKGTMSRHEIACETGLTAAAITVLVKDLIDSRTVIETGTIQRNKSGRKETLIEINYEDLRVANITIESDKIYFSICTRYKTILEKTFDCSVIKTRDPLSLADDYILDLHGNNKHKIRGIGIGVIGKVDAEKGILVDSRGLFPPNFPLKKIMNTQYPYPTIVTNNVRAQAYSIISSNLNDFLYIKHGPALGGAIVSNGRIVRGSENNAGEIGMTLVPNIHEPITLGNYTSEKRIRNIYLSKTSYDIEIEEIYKRFNSDTIANSIISDCITQIAQTIANTCLIIDPAKIVLSGGLFNYLDIFNKTCTILLEANCAKPILRPDNVEKMKFLASGNVALKSCLFGLLKKEEDDMLSFDA